MKSSAWARAAASRISASVASGLPTRRFSRDRAVEQQRLLKHDADIAAQPGERQRADVHAVDGDDAGLRIEGAVQERERRGFAAAGRADQRNAVAGQRGEAQVRDGGALAVIGKRHVVEFDQAAHTAGIDRIRPVAHRRHGVEHAEELGELRRIHEQAVGEADHLLEPRDQQRGDRHEADDLADRGKADELEIGADQRGSSSSVSVVAVRVSTAATAHHDSTGICARSSEFTRPFSAETSSSTRAKLCTTRDIAERVGGGLGEVGIMPLDRALHRLGPAA